MKHYSILFLASIFVIIISPAAMAEQSCTVYRFECLPEVNIARFEVFSAPCESDVSLNAEQQQKLAAKNIYFPGGKSPDTRVDTYTCPLEGRDLKVTIAPEFTDYQKTDILCVTLIPYVIKINGWLDGIKVIDDLNNGFACDGKKFIEDGNILLSLSISIGRIQNGEEKYPLEPDILFTAPLINNLTYEQRKFPFRITPPYDEGDGYTFMKVPLTNRHIHERHKEK